MQAQWLSVREELSTILNVSDNIPVWLHTHKKNKTKESGYNKSWTAHFRTQWSSAIFNGIINAKFMMRNEILSGPF